MRRFFSGFLLFVLLVVSPAVAQAANILYWADFVVGTDYMDQALTNLSGTHTVVRAVDEADFESKVAGGTWDLVILAIQNNGRAVPNFSAYVSGGGKAIFCDWTGDSGHGALFGVTFTGNNNQTSVSISDAQLAAGVTNPMGLSNTGWGTFSMAMATTTGTVAGTFPNGDAAIVISPNGNGIINGFLTDTPSPGADGVTLYENEINLLLAGAAPAFSVITPNGGEEIPTGSTYRITWDAFSGGVPAPVPAAALPVMYKVFHSGDSGATWTKLAGGLTSTSYDWYLPAQWGNTRRNLIRVVAYTTYVPPVPTAVAGTTKLGADVSDATFTISVVKVTSPEGGSVTGGSAATITWDTYLTMRPVAQTAVQLNCGTGWSTIATLSGNPGSYSWKVPSALEGATCKAKVVLMDRTHGTLGADASNSAFQVK